MVSEKKKYLTQRRKDAKIKNNLKKIMDENEIAKIIVDAGISNSQKAGTRVIRIGL